MIETDRLLLRRWHDDDLDALAALNADPEVMRYVADGRPIDAGARARNGSRSTNADWAARGGSCLFAVRARSLDG